MASSFKPPARGSSLFFTPFWRSRYGQNPLSTPTTNSARSVRMNEDKDPLKESSTTPLGTEPTSVFINTTPSQDPQEKAEPALAACTSRSHPLPPAVSALPPTLAAPKCQSATGVWAKESSSAGVSDDPRITSRPHTVKSSSADAFSEGSRPVGETDQWAGLSYPRAEATLLRRPTPLSNVARECPAAELAGFSPLSNGGVPAVIIPEDRRAVHEATPHGFKEWLKGNTPQGHQQCSSDVRAPPVLLQERVAGTPLDTNGVDLCMTNQSLMPLCMAGMEGSKAGALPKYGVPWHDASTWGARERQLQAHVVHLQATLAADQAKRQIEAALALNQCRGQQPVIITNTTEVGSAAQTTAVTAAPQSSTHENAYMGTRTNEALARAAAWCEGFMGSRVSQWVLVGGSVWLFLWLRNRLQLAWRLQYVRKRNDASLLYRASCCIRSCLNPRTGRDVSLPFL